MVTKRNAVDEGSLKGLSEDVEDGSDGIDKIMFHLLERAVGRDGRLTPEAEIQIALRSSTERGDWMDKLLLEVCPEDVDPGLGGWLVEKSRSQMRL